MHCHYITRIYALSWFTVCVSFYTQAQTEPDVLWWWCWDAVFSQPLCSCSIFKSSFLLEPFGLIGLVSARPTHLHPAYITARGKPAFGLQSSGLIPGPAKHQDQIQPVFTLNGLDQQTKACVISQHWPSISPAIRKVVPAYVWMCCQLFYFFEYGVWP